MAEATTETGEMAMKVFAVPELLENILLRLRLRDLLFASTVCTIWKSIVAGSPSIQRALFYKPGTIADVAKPEDDEIAQVERREDGYALNPFLFELNGADMEWTSVPPEVLYCESLLVPDSRRKMYLSQPPIKMCVRVPAGIPSMEFPCSMDFGTDHVMEHGSTFEHLVKACRRVGSELEDEGSGTDAECAVEDLPATERKNR
ncbi:hypothetical protein LTR53_007236 [Teratosphaeriaceae sp. CCFEE 6253]|nr:hypothetical protein LTR53_007236 [Teratosphaeriaceae sp. CCFEE 6253]